MNPDRFRKVEQLFHDAVELPPTERESFLQRECAGDADLRHDVDRMLEGDERAEQGVDRFQPFEWSEDPLLDQRLGPWRVIERMAEGGMGVVYRAERADGSYEQTVAIKVLGEAALSEQALRHFLRERQLLARLSHPQIARLLDAGRSPAGAPFLVMELVDGQPIDSWCKVHRLPLRERLRLFARVSRAVHYAHKNLVVHLDLKPSNILVDSQGDPKLLDFGIARLLDEEQGATPLTQGRALTPDYASPEQLRGEALTTATDVYSLGVVLFEMITGYRPWARKGTDIVDWQRMLKRESPPRPSTVATTGLPGRSQAVPSEFAATMRTTPQRLRRRLRGDLDRIVLMALRHEPDRRYESAEQLAEDLERYLGGLPVRAHSDSLGYRTARFVRRNQLPVAAGVLVLTSLCGGLWATARARVRAEEAAAAARAERARALDSAHHASIEANSFRQIAQFLGDSFLVESLDAEEQERLAQGVERQAGIVRRQYAGQAHLRANLLSALGETYARLGQPEQAEALLTEAHEIRLDLFGEESLENALSLTDLGRLDYASGRFELAAQRLERSLELHRGLPPGVHTDVAMAANDLAAVARNLGDQQRALALHQEALDLRRESSGPTSLPVAESLHNQALVHLDLGQLEPARERLEKALEIRAGILGMDHALTLQSQVARAGVSWQLGLAKQTEEQLRAAAQGYEALGESGEEGRIRTLSNLAVVQIAGGRLEAAENTTREAFESVLQRYGQDHLRTSVVLTRLGEIQRQRGQFKAAAETWEQVLDVRRRSYPAGHPRVTDALYQVGRTLREGGQYQRAEEYLREALQSAPKSDEEQASTLLDRAATQLALGACLVDAARPEEAKPLLLEARACFLEQEGPDSTGANLVAEQLARFQ